MLSKFLFLVLSLIRDNAVRCFPERRWLPSLRKSFGASAPIGETETGRRKKPRKQKQFSLRRRIGTSSD